MNAGKWIKQNTEKLKAAGIGSAQLDCLILLEDTLKVDRAKLLAHPEMDIKQVQLKKLNGQIIRRVKHEPLAYIRGKTEFYSRDFYIDKRVLEPRPESETIIDLLMKQLEHQTSKIEHLIIDIGAGSGALAITAKLELPGAKVIATDIDPKCLAVTRKNAKTYNAEIELLQGDMLEPLQTSNIEHRTTILANLPYVPDRWQINEAAAQEPRIAIFGGPDGLDLYRKLFSQTKSLEIKPLLIFTEALPPQHEELAKIARAASYELVQSQDFIQVFNRQ